MTSSSGPTRAASVVLNDTSSLSLTGQLFGREAEMRTLADALARVKLSGTSELVLMAGSAGTGKSALGNWLSLGAAREGLRVAAGKNDQSHLDIPYAPVVQLIQALTMGLLGDDDATLAPVRQRWLGALAGQGRAVAELVPETEHVLGRTAPLSEVPAAQARIRAETAILATFSAFASDGSPLVLFVDDLQWMDASTVALLEAFVRQHPPNILLVAAYRDHGNEIDQRFSWLLHANRSGALPVTRIAVRPLGIPALTELVADALNETAARVEELGRAVHRKTAGNPFFARQLLGILVDDGVLSHRPGDRRWVWNESELRHHRYADNVVDLMILRFARLPRAGAALLQLAAHVGIRCETGLLARLAGIDVGETMQRLQPFVEAGLLQQVHDSYVFQHDRILESAYSLSEPQSRAATHARIALIMIGCWQERLAENAFDICNQIELATGYVPAEAEAVAFVDVLLLAGRRAKHSAALPQAARYTDAAFGLMAASWWNSHYAQAYATSLLHCECLLAQARLDEASREIDILLARTLPPGDEAAAHRLKAVLRTVRSDYEGAIDAALSGLALLDVHLGRRPDSARMKQSYDVVKRVRGARSIASLGELPATSDPRIHTIMGLLSTLISSLFVRDGISFLHVAKMVELTLEHGATPESAYGLSWYGVFIASLYGEYEDGLAYGLAAMALIDRHGYDAERIAALVAIDQVSPWTKPLPYALRHAEEAIVLGRASGDIGMACYACNHIVSDLLAMGEYLPLVEEEIERGLVLTRSIQYQDIELILNSQRHFVRCVRSPRAYAATADGGATDETTALERLSLSNSLPTIFWILLYDGMARVYLHEWDSALRSLKQAEELIWSAPAHINVADCRLFLALALAHAPAASSDITSTLAAIAPHRDCLATWTALNPGTFRSKLLLLDAEILRLRSQPLEALASYEASAIAAGAAGFVHEQALAHEFAGALCDAHGLHTSGRQHLRRARECYRRWGADFKATRLTDSHPSLDDGALDEPARPAAAASHAGHGWELGVKAAQAMSSEIVMDRLIESLMTTTLVRAGAQYGLLLLMRGDQPMIEASARVTGGKVAVTLGTAIPTSGALPLAVLNSVLRTQQTLVLADAMTDAPSLRIRTGDTGNLRSVLCLPIVRSGDLAGVFYLENNLAPGVFDATRIHELEVLAPQVAISLETARLYEQLFDENNRRVTAEIDLRNARTELAQTSHLTVMGSLAASIAHEINQPLTAIMTTADASLRWLNRPQPDLGEALDGLSHIRQNAVRAADIVRALRALAKQAPAVLTPLSPDDVVREVLGMVRMETEAHRVTVVTSLAAGNARVEADRVQLQQVVLNLITNALDAMADLPPGQRELLLTSGMTAQGVMVSVQDRGAGIPDAVRDRIFDPLFTTRRDGMGMGLAICRSIVEAHGGTLAALARSDGGSEFVFCLPACAPEQAP